MTFWQCTEWGGWQQALASTGSLLPAQEGLKLSKVCRLCEWQATNCNSKEGRRAQHQLLSDHLLALLHLQGMQSESKMTCPAAGGACWGLILLLLPGNRGFACIPRPSLVVRALRCGTAQRALQRG